MRTAFGGRCTVVMTPMPATSATTTIHRRKESASATASAASPTGCLPPDVRGTTPTQIVWCHALIRLIAGSSNARGALRAFVSRRRKEPDNQPKIGVRGGRRRRRRWRSLGWHNSSDEGRISQRQQPRRASVSGRRRPRQSSVRCGRGDRRQWRSNGGKRYRRAAPDEWTIRIGNKKRVERRMRRECSS